jgi:hypothetical protein
MEKLIIIILFFKAFQCEAQLIIKNSIELKDTTMDRSITFEVPKGTQQFKYILTGFLTSGVFSVSLSDPDNNQKEGFQLTAEAGKTETIKPAKGEMLKTIDSPLPGIWKLNIRTRNGLGKFTYQINFIKK